MITQNHKKYDHYQISLSPPPPVTHLYVYGPLHAPRASEGISCDGIFHVAEDEEIKEEPAHRLNQEVVPLPLLIIH